MIISNEKNDILNVIQSNIDQLVNKISYLYDFNSPACICEIRDYVSKLYDNNELEFRKLDKFTCPQVYCTYGRGDSPAYHFVFNSHFTGIKANSLLIGIDASFMISEDGKNHGLQLDSKHLRDTVSIIHQIDGNGVITFSVSAKHFANYLSNEEYRELITFLGKYDFVPRLSVTAYIFSEDTVKKIVKEIIAIIFKYISLSTTEDIKVDSIAKAVYDDSINPIISSSNSLE